MCTTDRVHLCAQSLYGGTKTGAAAGWWPFVHCMFMNIDGLKCGNNGHCDESSTFRANLAGVLPACAAMNGVDAALISACADGPDGVALQKASYARTTQTAKYGFAPAFVDGSYVEGADAFWRKSPDQLLYGQSLIEAICTAGTGPSSADATACQNNGTATPSV